MRSCNERVPILLPVAGLISLIAGLFAFPVGTPSMSWLVLPMLALVTEFLPVQFHRRGLRVTFALPFLAGMVVVAGVPGAMAADMATSLAAAYLLRSGREPLISTLSIGAISMAFGGAICSLVEVRSLSDAMVQALIFTAIHGSVNLFLVSAIDSGREPLRIHEVLRRGALPLFVYGLLAVAVASLAFRDAAWALPLALGPVLGIRAIVMAEAKAGQSYYETLTALAMMLQRAHPYTHRHLARVALASEEVALRLGLSPRRARMVREAAILHDIGKIAVDEAILDKPDKLTKDEFEHVKLHSVFGERILEPISSFGAIRKWIRHHHERPDGTGYPDGLPDREIPIESKIIAVVDAFDAMVGGADGRDKRSYRDPMTQKEALAELERCAGSQFDRNVVSAFRTVILGGVG